MRKPSLLSSAVLVRAFVVALTLVGLCAGQGQWWNPPVEKPTPRATDAAAVSDAVAYLLERQEANGGWDPQKILGQAGPAIASLAVMALSSHEKTLPQALRAKTRVAIRRGVAYLTDAEVAGGRVAVYQHRMQNWNNALMALCWLHLRRIHHTDAYDGPLLRTLEAISKSQEAEGGWTYSANWSRARMSTTIQTPFVLLALAEAKRQGFAIPMNVITKGLGFLDSTRRRDDSYLYSLATTMEDARLGSSGRMVGCELARIRLGVEDAPLPAAIKNFLSHRDALEVTRSSVVPRARRRAVGHWGEEHTARYYFFSGHWLCAEALRHGEGDKELSGLRGKLRLIQEEDGSFRDSAEHGWAYSTAMALSIFARSGWLTPQGATTPPPATKPKITPRGKASLEVAAALDRELKGDLTPVSISAVSLYGLAILSQHGTLDRGSHGERIARLSRRLFDELPELDTEAPEAWWALGLGSIFLSEAYMNGPGRDSRARLVRLSKRILGGRKKDGGWPVHGYGDITAHTSLMTVALTRLERCGAKLPSEARDALFRYLEQVTYEDGAVEYGLRLALKNRAQGITSYSTIETAARNAGVLLALMELGKQDSDLFRRVNAWTDRHSREIPFGHASPQFARLIGGIASYRLGPKVWSRFHEEVLSLGSNPPRPRDRKPVRKTDPHQV